MFKGVAWLERARPRRIAKDRFMIRTRQVSLDHEGICRRQETPEESKFLEVGAYMDILFMNPTNAFLKRNNIDRSSLAIVSLASGATPR